MNKEVNNLNLYYNSDKCRIIYLEGQWCDIKLAPNLKNTDYIFVQFTWNIEKVIDYFPWDYFEIQASFYNNFDIKKNIIFCAPTEEIKDIIKDKGYRTILLNHNCLLDYNKYNIETNNELERKYNAVINSRPFWWKRVYLASKVNNLLYIKGNDWAKDKTSWDGYKDMKLTLKSEVSQETVNNLYNNSKVGLILSGNTGENQQGLAEGANYSSSEYLLCGLPVVSTKSGGGRDYWFDNYNSIICEPNEDSVKNSVDIMLEKLSNGEIDREKIRNTQIEKMNLMRENFINETKKIFNAHSVNVDAKQFFKDNFFHKMCDYQKKGYDEIVRPQKLLVIFRGNEGSTYLVNRLSKLELLHDLGYEVFDKYVYKRKNIQEKNILSAFENDFYNRYKLYYNGKIPYCKCRINNYYNKNSYDQFHKLIKKSNITHIIYLSRFEFESIVRLNYLQNLRPHEEVVFGRHENSLGQFNENRNELLEKLRGSLTIQENKFEEAIKSKKKYITDVESERTLISEWKDVKLLNLDYTELNDLNNKQFNSMIRKFLNIDKEDYNIIENESMNVVKKKSSWIDLFDEESKKYLKNKSKMWDNFLHKMCDYQKKGYDEIVRPQKLSKIIIVYSLERTGTHLTINTIVKNIYLNDSYLVYNLDKIDNFDVFIKENNYEFIIFKTHIYENLISLLKIVDKDKVNLVLPSTEFYRGCISFINYTSTFLNNVSDPNRQLKIVDERYNSYIEYYKHYDYLINNSYNAFMIERENYDSNKKVIKIIHKLSDFLNLKIKDKNNYIFPDDKNFLKANKNELHTVQPLQTYDIKIFDSTIDYIKKLSSTI